jgi:hypothetical protein
MVFLIDVERARNREKINISINPTAITGGVTAHNSMTHGVSRRSTPRSGKPVDHPNFHRGPLGGQHNHFAVQDADVDP